jgi:DNA-binding transcriptional LysR family regulator
MDKLESMRAFTQVAIYGGFAPAARAMGLSRSNVNKLVVALENELGVQLFHRSTRVVTLTEMGLAFYQRCVDILAAIAAAERAVMQLHDEPKGNLKINAPMTFGTMHLAPVLADFALRYPDLRVQLTLNDRFVDPIEEGLDLTIRIAKPQKSKSLIFHPLAPVRLLLCAAPSYLAKHGIPAHPDRLRQHSCLHYGQIISNGSWELGREARHISIPIAGSLCSNNGEVLKDAAVKGLGITLLPEFIVKAEIDRGNLQTILPDYEPTPLILCIIYPTDRHLSTKVRLLIDFLDRRFGDRPSS